MEESVDSLFQLDERTGCCDLDNRSLKFCSYRILLVDSVPWIVLNLLDSKRDLSLAQVVAQDHALDFVADFEHVLRIVDFLYPGELGNMCHALDSLLQLDECAEIGKLGNLSCHDVVHMIALFEGVPWILCEMLERQVDLVVLLVQVDDLEFDLLSFLDIFLRLGHMAPAHVVDMEKTVESAQVYECTECSDSLDCSLHSVTLVHCVVEFLFLLGEFLSKVLSSVEHQVHLFLVATALDKEHGGDSDIWSRILNLDNICLGDRQEALECRSDSNFKTTLHNLGDLTFYC